MLEKELQIINKLGLHARAAAKFVTTASRFQAEVQLCREQRCVNGKSIMGVMMLAAAKGTRLRLVVDGSDEAEVTDALESLVADKFGEGE